jgi:hypothetical protein
MPMARGEREGHRSKEGIGEQEGKTTVPHRFSAGHVNSSGDLTDSSGSHSGSRIGSESMHNLQGSSLWLQRGLLLPKFTLE